MVKEGNVKNGIFLGGRYEVLSKVGAGGMADVYKGRDTMLNRYVAVKVLKKEYREDEDFVRKFRSEAQAAAGLLNPNIVNVYDVGEDRGLYYMVMELVDGITLKDYIEKKGRLSHKEVISIAIQMCNGIGAAHAAGIIHRDIKPQNIIISRDGKVKVTDFGIAKAVTSNTISSNAMGSVHYTSPEQARGGYSDAKSDIYSIGITLFEMVTGQVPFDGDSTVSVAIKHLQEEVTPPSEIVPGIPYSLEQIILKCTQKNGERRYASTAALVQDMKRSLVDPDGDFVVIPPLRNADTVIIRDDELDDIRQSYEEDEYGYGDDDYDDDRYDDDYDDDRYDDDDYDDDRYDDDDYEYDDYKRRSDGRDKKGRKGSEEVNPRMNKVMKILMIVVAVIIVFIAIFAVGKAAGIFKSFGTGLVKEDEETTVKVPDIVGKNEEEAREILKKKNIGLKVIAREESNKYDEGIICEQKQKAGSRVKKNSTIQVVISTGLIGEEIVVPEVSGMSEEDAQRTLTDHGFKKVSSDYQYDDSVPEGDVISTTPASGAKATEDTDIKMLVSKGAQKKAVPNMVGKNVADAQNELAAVNLIPNIIYEASEKYDVDIVTAQDIAGGKKVAPETVITITVSTGSDKVTVENFVGKPASELENWAWSNGLNPIVSEERYTSDTRYPYGTVISQSKTSGKMTKGETISYVISMGPEPEPEPSGPDQGNGSEEEGDTE
ncbi:MAG: Stk1 family PASTA domain-containing Ser/Thr kinase [Dorea sp.]|nr:Stk1 family PASTA domain-containing Ser/Thr kinase [Dorea sp.]